MKHMLALHTDAGYRVHTFASTCICFVIVTCACKEAAGGISFRECFVQVRSADVMQDGTKLDKEERNMMFRKEEKEWEMDDQETRFVVLLHPVMEDWKDVLCIAGDRLVCINLEKMELEDKQRFMDRISGGVYTAGGHLHPITENVYLLGPEDVRITENGMTSDEIG